MKPEQLDLLKTPAERAEPWRVAAQTVLNNPFLPECVRITNHAYYTRQADLIDRGES
jgi:hypothetical protein